MGEHGNTGFMQRLSSTVEDHKWKLAMALAAVVGVGSVYYVYNKNNQKDPSRSSRKTNDEG